MKKIKATLTDRGKNPWRIVIPAKLDPNGKRKYHYFATEKESQAFVSAYMEQIRKNGTVVPQETLSASLKWNALTELLAEYDISPLQAVQDVVSIINEFGSVAKCRALAKEGHGAESAPDSPNLDEIIIMIDKHRKLAPHTARGKHFKRKRIRTAAPHLFTTPLAKLTTRDFESAINKENYSYGTFNEIRKELHILCEFALKKQYITSNPITPIFKCHQKETEILAVTPDQLALLLIKSFDHQPVNNPTNSTHKELLGKNTTQCALYFALAAYAGIRPYEVPRLAWGDIDWEEQVISIRARHSKTGGTRHIHLHPTLSQWLKLYYRDQSPHDPIITTKDILKKLNAVRIRCGYNNDTNPWQKDCLRHSFASYSLKSGRSTDDIIIDMGHMNAKLLRTRYLNMRGVNKQTAEEYWSYTPEKIQNRLGFDLTEAIDEGLRIYEKFNPQAHLK